MRMAFAAVKQQMGRPNGSIRKNQNDTAMGNDIDYLPRCINWSIANGSSQDIDPVQTKQIGSNQINNFQPMGDRCII